MTGSHSRRKLDHLLICMEEDLASSVVVTKNCNSFKLNLILRRFIWKDVKPDISD